MAKIARPNVRERNMNPVNTAEIKRLPNVQQLTMTNALGKLC